LVSNLDTMIRLLRACAWIVPLLLAVPAAAQPPALTVLNTAPTGEIASLSEAGEIRIVFSEPMVPLGRIPDSVAVPFVRISPSISGTFRWSGTTVLVFTADPKRPLPYATTYEVTIAATATAVSGRRLDKPVTFRFTTPTAKLLETNWYRRDGTVNSPMVVLLRFNQPVRQQDVAAALTMRLEPHEWTPPEFTADARARLEATAPGSLERFQAKVRAVQAVAGSSARVSVRPTSDWDRTRYPASPELVVFELPQVAPESHVKLTLSPTLRSPGGPETPGGPQEFTLEAERAFFVDGPWCVSQCDGDLRNHIRMRSGVKTASFAASLTVVDITRAERPVARAGDRRPPDQELDWTWEPTLEDAGYDPQPPNSRYAITIAPDLRSVDGQTLGYTWAGIVENWHMRAFTSFGDGHGVWEKDGGTQLPFYARNITEVTQWATPVTPRELMPLLVRLQERGFEQSPSGAGIVRRIAGTSDRIESHGLDLSKALRPGGTGLVWAAVREGDPIPRSRRMSDDERSRVKSSVVQVTNLGITVKDSPQNTLVFVTRLDNGEPVSGARVSIVRTDNSTFWEGTTNGGGIAVAPQTPLRDPEDYWKFSFVVTAEKDGDVAYVGSDWNEGISPWDFGTSLNLRESSPLLRGSVFTDRGVYRLGEEIRLKAVLRHNTPQGIRLLPPDTPVSITVRDGQSRVVDERTVRVNGWSSAEWAMTLPRDGTLGNYSIQALLESDRPSRSRRGEPRQDEENEDAHVNWDRAVHASFLVAAYRRPDFRVDVTLTGTPAIAGDRLSGAVAARYLFGAPVGARPVSWKFSRSVSYAAPAAVTDRFPQDRWAFVGYDALDDDRRWESGDLRSEETKLTADGQLALQLDTERDAGLPFIYRLEADVEDVSRQHIANRASLTVHPAPFYVGIRRPPSYFVDQKSGYRTQVVAPGLDGTPVAGVPVELTLTQIQWNSVRRAQGNGFYTWESERRVVPVRSWRVTTAAEPVPVDIELPGGGYFVLRARGEAPDGRFAVTHTSFYALGTGYTAWERFDHNRIELTPERATYRPGETARIMIQSPWERATALVTTEREGIRTHRQFTLTSTQESIAVPITESDIPNVFVSVVLVKGRTTAPASTSEVAANPEADVSDPGKPAFRMGYVELNVEDRSKRLTVAVAADREEYRPASGATVRLDVRDHQDRGVASEVTLWAVDYGVLSLTAYRAPDVAAGVYVRKALQVLNADSRQRIVSRRVLSSKGETEGGGGGSDAGAGAMRRDFRVLAFWIGSVVTGADGRASVEVKLPESLTTYRIMAVAGDRSSRFGSGEAEVRTNKPLTLKPAFPRFMTAGDRAYFGAVVGSQLPSAGTAVVTMKSLDPAVLAFEGGGEQRVTLGAGGTIEVRFDGVARGAGQARVQMSVRVGDETDAFEDVIPVTVPVTPEVVAAYGEAAGAAATETLTLPASVVPGFGGLRVEVASTALVGLGEGARYLVEYPYGCAEQKASRGLALLLAADLGDAFALPGVDTASIKPAVQQALRELETFQCPNGGFAYWPGDCTSVSPYLTSYVLHVFRVASTLGYRADAALRDRAYSYLERQLAAEPPANEAWRPSYTAWQAFALKVLVEGGRQQDSNITRVYDYRDRMPVFALAYLHDALVAKKETSGARIDELRRRMTNAILAEAGSAHVEELSDPYLLWFWNSNVRSTAIVLNSLVGTPGSGGARAAADRPPFVRELVRWLMNARTNGRWGNTQENAYAMEALVNYYRRFEPDVPSFRAIVRVGEQELLRESFEGRSAESRVKDVPLAELPRAASQPLTLAREGTGTLFYTTRLQYAPDAPVHEALDSGFIVERRYEPFVENGTRPAATSYAAGDLVRVTLTLRLTKERRFVAVTDPLPAGFEAVESWFATTRRQLAAQQDQGRYIGRDGEPEDGEWDAWWRRGGFDHVERHDDRVQLFATRLSEGRHEFSYIVRATTAGTFKTAPARAEEMYSPEVFGRTASTLIEVKR